MTEIKKTSDCGLLGIYPKCLQKLANSHMFIIVYGFLGLIQATSFIYMTLSLTQIEKRFKIPSQTTGLILSGNEISQVLSLILMYYGGAGHRPKWLATGVGLSAISCFILVLPHLIYGPGKAALALTQEYNTNNSILLNTTTLFTSEYLSMCPNENINNNSIESCDNEDEWSDAGLFPRFLVFFSQFVLGIGTTLYFGLGQTYLDDNSEQSNTPMLLGITFALRTTGPALGFILAYICMKFYIVPDLHPVINDKDPRWLGAWWLGWIILGLLLAIFALLIAMFPRNLPRKNKKHQQQEEEGEIPLNIEKKKKNLVVVALSSEDTHEYKPTLRDFITTFIRVTTNKILLINNLSAVFNILGVIPYMTFIPKYLEVQFGTSAAGGTVITGPIALVAMVLGFFISGWFISKYRPKPAKLLSWNVFGGFIWATMQIIFIFNTCEIVEHRGIDQHTFAINLTSTCNVECHCDGVKYSPVCHEATKTTFFSACHAGCRNSSVDSKYYSNCSCIEEAANRVIVGPCRGDCTNAYIIFMILSMISNFLSATGRIGNVLVNYRCVEKRDKSVSQGVTLMIVSLFALIPGPILYGTIIDQSCLLWEPVCGKRGNCWHYDKEKFRYLFNAAAALFTFIGVLFDVGVCYLSRNLDLYGASEQDKRAMFAQDETTTTIRDNK